MLVFIFLCVCCLSARGMVIVRPVGSPTVLGEGPHWDKKQQVLYFVDINESNVIKYDPATNTQTSVKVDGGTVSIVIPVEGKKNQFVITVGRSVAVMTWDGKSSKPTKVEILSTVDNEEGKENNRFNDGKADPTGRLWAGTMGAVPSIAEVERFKGSMFSFTKDGKPITHVTGITISNGFAWSRDLKTMYYVDSFTLRVDAFDFNAKSGNISNRRVAFDFQKNNVTGLPDGITIDTEGNLWVACFNGAQVIRVDPTSGKLLRAIPIPSLETTSVAFGGRNLDVLYVTSASYFLTEEQRQEYPYAGYTFRVTGVGAKGLPAANVRLA